MTGKSLGLLSILFVYTVWGTQALYWKLFQDYQLISILAYRVIWSFILLIIIIFTSGKTKKLLALFRTVQSTLKIALCAFLIAFNWLLNIYAAYSEQLVEASLGQYITPIVVICSGIFILKEKIRIYETAALIIAFAGVVILTWNTGKIPMIAVFLVFTFSAYTFFKKTFDLDPFLGITAEVIILAPFALIWLIAAEGGNSARAESFNILRLLLPASTGLFTALPLILFSYGIRHINLSRLGFIQYYAPSLSLIIGVFIFREPFNTVHLVSFIHIWTAILIVLFFSLYRGFYRKKSPGSGISRISAFPSQD